ncbi:Thioredoxin domain protein [Gloeothece citriformis PCC 7424]|uniref:Thioredoxin domain protein n=1 Tax=Gloeothece citriformis (strain PCC 7424) TaxID=65393 RepID=B7KID3_GLOC7|nr:tetratricopeptide repeat protein [Gloeothece citriformis]ACK73620.1 Thioredoxin domain protein [Gloeothece citriformis PCC 7424]
MGYSVEVNSNNYNSEVDQASYTKTVIVDFYATWCGPCKLLKPILEKLVQEYDFILAKVDIDQNPDLANRFSIEGVPDVRVVAQGEMYPGFVGAMSEPQIRSLLAQLNLKSELELGLEAVRDAMAANNPQQAKQLLDLLFTKYPDNPIIALEAARFLIKLNRLDDAEKILKTIREDKREFYPKAQAFLRLIDLKQVVNNPGETELDQLYAQAARLTLAEDYENALPLFLQVVQTERKYRDDGARKSMIAIFNMLGLDHPLTKQYQQELMLALY